MARQPGFFDADERFCALSVTGDPLERLRAVVDFELFRPELEAALDRADRSRGGWPPYDALRAVGRSDRVSTARSAFVHALRRACAARAEGKQRQGAEIAVPVFGYKNHLGVDRTHGFIRRFTVTHAARHDAANSPPCSIRPTPRARSGPTPPIAAEPIWNVSRSAAWWLGSSAPSHAATHAAAHRPRQCNTGAVAQPGRARLRRREAAPDEAHEAVRELVRSREAAVDDLRRKRQSISCCVTAVPTRARRAGRASPAVAASPAPPRSEPANSQEGCSAVTMTGTSSGPRVVFAFPSKRRHHVNTRLVLTSYRRATTDTDAPGAVAAATISRLSASGQDLCRPLTGSELSIIGLVDTSCDFPASKTDTLHLNYQAGAGGPPQRLTVGRTRRHACNIPG